MVELNANIESSFKFLNFQPVLKMTRFNKALNVEQDGIACNGKMIAAQTSATASVVVVPADKPTQFSPATPLLKGHMGNIYDTQFSPFEDRLLATTADDGKLNLWVFDDFNGTLGGDHMTQPDIQINAH